MDGGKLNRLMWEADCLAGRADSLKARCDASLSRESIVSDLRDLLQRAARAGKERTAEYRKARDLYYKHDGPQPPSNSMLEAAYTDLKYLGVGRDSAQSDASIAEEYTAICKRAEKRGIEATVTTNGVQLFDGRRSKKVKTMAELEEFMGSRADAQDDPCWTGFEQRGTKEKNGETVPNCVKADQADRADAPWPSMPPKSDPEARVKFVIQHYRIGRLTGLSDEQFEKKAQEVAELANVPLKTVRTLARYGHIF